MSGGLIRGPDGSDSILILFMPGEQVCDRYGKLVFAAAEPPEGTNP